LAKRSESKLDPKSTSAVDDDPRTTPAPRLACWKLGGLTTVPPTSALPHATCPSAEV
jgi:hypothetical protein